MTDATALLGSNGRTFEHKYGVNPAADKGDRTLGSVRVRNTRLSRAG